MMADKSYQFDGAGWSGEVYGRDDRWSWACLMSHTRGVSVQGCTGFHSAASAERSLKAFVVVQDTADIDRWVRFASRIGGR